VPPGVNPGGTAQGPRVPLVIVSPYAKRGYTDTTPPHSPESEWPMRVPWEPMGNAWELMGIDGAVSPGL